MKIEYFIKKRRLIIICLLSELILISLVYFTSSLLIINFLELVIFFTIYLLIGYILGKYELLLPKNFKSIQKFVHKYSFLFIINYSFQLFYFILNNSNNNYLDILRYNLIFITLNFLLHLLLLIILGNKYKDSIWLYLIRKESKIELDEYIENYNKINLKKIKLLNINDLYNFYLMDIDGLITENNYFEEDNNLSGIILNINNINKVDIIEWSNNFLEFLPINFLNKNYIKSYILRRNMKKIYSYLKRFGDIFISTLLVIILLPLMFLVSILIKIEDGGPIFYSQKRTGYKEKIFNIYKFRSMKVDAENTGIQWSTRGDSRITNIGKILRLTRIDELPQLLSVIKGEMSLIGPRPERPEINKILFKETNIYKYRYLIKPGLSGWAQVNYNYAASAEESKIKLGYDMFYLRNSSFLLDILIIFKTIKIIFNLKGALPN